MVEWFGYQRHLLADVRHEVSLAYDISDTKTGDNEQIPVLLEQAHAQSPVGRIQTLAYDKAADDEQVQEVLHTAGLKPLIQNRALWKEEPERPLLGGRYPLHLVHDEAGTVYCYEQVSVAMARWRRGCRRGFPVSRTCGGSRRARERRRRLSGCTRGGQTAHLALWQSRRAMMNDN